jgi:hypothetical protein
VDEEAHGPAPAPDKTQETAQARQMPPYTFGRGAIAAVPLLDEAARAGTSSETESKARADKRDAKRERRPDVRPLEEQRAEDKTKDKAEEKTREKAEDKTEEKKVGPMAVAPVADVSGAGEERHATGHGLTLQGRTDADYHSTFRTANVTTTQAADCQGCAAGDCVRVRGTLVSTYTVNTTVTLPSVNDFPDLTPCQRRRVQDAITNVLAPHEQRHVRAFKTYEGTTRQPFDMTICRGDFDAAMQSMHDSEQAARQAAAQARSDALDPFQFDVDLDCEEPHAKVSQVETGEATAASA